MRRVRIALPGSDVHDTRPGLAVLDSLLPNPKIDTTANPRHAGTLRLDWRTTGLAFPAETEVILHKFEHGYKYVPSVIASYAYEDTNGRSGGTFPLFYGAIGVFLMDADKTNVYLKYFSTDFTNVAPVLPFTIDIRFYVMAELGF